MTMKIEWSLNSKKHNTDISQVENGDALNGVKNIQNKTLYYQKKY